MLFENRIRTISEKVAAPVAKQGEPKNPVKNLSTKSPAKFSTKAVGMHRMTNIAKVQV